MYYNVRMGAVRRPLLETMYCTQCGHQNDDSARFCANCGAALQPPTEETTSDAAAPAVITAYAGFWKRLAAGIIDWLLLGVVFSIFYLPFDSVGFWVLDIAIWWAYFSLMESSPQQGTLGKMALGIIVTDVEGRRISLGRATGRHFSKVALLLLFIPFIVSCIAIAFTDKKQALHDMMAECLVLTKS